MRRAIRMIYEAVLISTLVYVVFTGAQLLIVQDCGKHGRFSFGILNFRCEVIRDKPR